MIDTSTGVVVRQRVHVADLDAFGMLYHARFATLFDNAVQDFWLDAGWQIDPAEAVLVIRDLQLTYHQPVLGIGDVDVHFWVERAGTTSVTYRFQVLSADRTVRHADGHRVVVFLDGRTLRPTPIPDDVWDLAAPLLAPGVTRRRAA
ncbi:thioesterase family protein [Nocardioides sp. TF02-7]|uniref:acyl-CoA thioesterase n=1 Tax=Nocardioides sp. TF02-7 TaxID=2917724 RepID=UPI001F051AFE|nr:thioesterase family protein [Nocardioides sp. TF02-7]UMG93261.1 acyl-CoA thioesterase [Nocardioides sp. TF02-7]